MAIVFGLLGIVLGLVGLVCGIIILIDAFKNEIWKGLLCLFCWPYTLYYAFVEFENDKKPLILAGWLGGAIIGIGLRVAAMGMSIGSIPGTTH